jgi:hypothetical protein
MYNALGSSISTILAQGNLCYLLAARTNIDGAFSKRHTRDLCQPRARHMSSCTVKPTKNTTTYAKSV